MSKYNRQQPLNMPVAGCCPYSPEKPSMIPMWQSNEAWTCTLVGLVNIGNNEIVDISADAPIGYDAQYSKLAFARQPADDPFPRIDPQNFFLRELHSLSTSSPGS